MTVEHMATRSRTAWPRGGRSAVRGAVRRIGSLGRAEALLLRRNKVALFTALAIPVSLMPLLRQTSESGAGESGGAGGAGGAAEVVTGLTAFLLLAAVYYNLVTALVARREEFVLKRLRTGEASDAEILAGTAAPAVAVAWAQILLGGVAAIVLFDLAWPVDVLLVALAVGLGTAVFALLAALTSVVTRTVETAQITTMPGLVVSLVFAGLIFPLDELAGPWELVARLLPLTNVVDLLRLGLAGLTADGRTVDFAGSLGAAVVPALVLAAWVAVGAWATRRWFRWEPRR